MDDRIIQKSDKYFDVVSLQYISVPDFWVNDLSICYWHEIIDCNGNRRPYKQPRHIPLKFHINDRGLPVKI
jgi:hypothetical protein